MTITVGRGEIILMPQVGQGEIDIQQLFFFLHSIQSITEMLKQVGHLQIENGLCKKGLIVRYLILPNHIENSLKVLEVLTGIDKNIHISLMNQYHPMHKANEFEELNRPLNKDEFGKVYNRLLELGFDNGWIQEEDSAENYLPDFTKQKPFDI